MKKEMTNKDIFIAGFVKTINDARPPKDPPIREEVSGAAPDHGVLTGLTDDVDDYAPEIQDPRFNKTRKYITDAERFYRALEYGPSKSVIAKAIKDIGDKSVAWSEAKSHCVESYPEGKYKFFGAGSEHIKLSDVPYHIMDSIPQAETRCIMTDVGFDAWPTSESPKIPARSIPLLNTMSVNEFCSIKHHDLVCIRTTFNGSPKNTVEVVVRYEEEASVHLDFVFFVMRAVLEIAPDLWKKQWRIESTDEVLFRGLKPSMMSFNAGHLSRKKFMDRIIRKGNYGFCCVGKNPPRIKAPI